MTTASIGIVTGAARGMGWACASRLASLVDTLVLVDRDPEGLQRAADSLRGGGVAANLEPFQADITDRDALARLAQRAGELGTLRAVAHAAGVSPTMDDWRTVLAVDLVGSAALVEALRPLATSGTAVVCFASIAAHLGAGADAEADAVLDDPLAADFLERLRAAVGEGLEDPGLAYMWAKRGVHRLVRREALSFGRAGARICSVTPGIIDTPMGRQEAAAQPVMEMLVRSSALAREGTADEVAAAVAFLVSDDASFVTGVDLTVDGGVIAAVQSGAPIA